LFSGLEKFESGGTYNMANYTKNVGHIAQGITSASFLPLWATRAFAFSLGYVFIALAVLLLLGIKTRVSLLINGLVYVGLGLGLMAVQEGEGAVWIANYLIVTVGALVLVRHNRFALWADRHD